MTVRVITEVPAAVQRDPVEQLSLAEIQLHPLPRRLREAVAHDPVLQSLGARREIGGAILILPPEPGADLVRLSSRRFPFVVVDPRTALPRDIPSVSAAHHTGARQLTTYLAQAHADR